MASTFNKPDPTREGPNGWTVVGEETFSGDREPQFKDCNISSSQQGTVTAEHEHPGLTITRVGDIEHCLRNFQLAFAEVKAQNSEPGKSTAAGPASSTGPLRLSPPVGMEHCQLTPASLHAYNMTVWACDIRAWVNGELCWRRMPVGDSPTVTPLLENSNSIGSASFILVPGQLPSTGHVVQAAGTWADNFTYNDKFEV